MTTSHQPTRWPETRPGRRGISLLVILLLAVTALTGTAALAGAAPATGDESPPAEKIEPTLTEALEKSGRGDFVIEFSQEADLAAASRIDDWEQRGAAVVAALRRTARESQAEVLAELDAAGVDHQSFWIDNSVHVGAGSREIALHAASDPAVTEVREEDTVPLEEPEPATRLATSDDVEWGVSDIGADQVWDRFDDRGEGIVVANIDSGVQFDHPALVSAYRGNRGDGSFDHDYNWFDPAHVCGLPSATPCDNNGHGSHTMGTMVGDGGAGARIGVAPGARWIAAKGCEFSGCSEASLAAAAQWVLAPTDLQGQHPDPGRRPHVVNNSWGGPGGNDWYRDFVRAWVASGIFPAFSNGNEGPDCGTAGAPGEYPEAYSVGNYAADGVINETSSRGAGTTGETKPDISAPGTAVRSSVPTDRYQVFSGTSMAAPHLAATVALMWSASPALLGDVTATRQILDDGARNTADDQCGGDVEDNNVYGEGRLDALAAVTSSPRGEVGTLAGQVTDGDTGDPLEGVTVSLTGSSSRTAVTDARGEFSATVTAGTYDVVARSFGYVAGRAEGVVVSSGGTTTQHFQLAPAERVDLRGTVRDGSGQGWPVYARVAVLGTPVHTFTDPVTGTYHLSVPTSEEDYRIEVDPQYEGYDTRTVTTPVEGPTARDVEVTVDPSACTAPGYRRGDGLREAFDEAAVPAGWQVVDSAGTGQTWTFDDPGDHGNLTGGVGGFAVVDSDAHGDAGSQDTSLVTPSVDLSEASRPVIEFGTDVNAYWLERADVDVTVDGGATWTTAWRAAGDVRRQRVTVPLPGAAGEPDVRVRFRYWLAGDDWWWQVDDVYLGDRDCHPVEGGLVVGRTTTSLTGRALDGATVSQVGAPEVSDTSGPTPSDETIGDGFYSLFSPTVGSVGLRAAAREHDTEDVRVRVGRGAVTRRDIGLGSGHLVASKHRIERTLRLGRKATVTLKIHNRGDGPARFELDERNGEDVERTSAPAAATPADTGARGAPLVTRRAPASPLPGRHVDGPPKAAPDGRAGGPAPHEAPWRRLAPYPTRVKDSVAGYQDGLLYSFGGTTGDGPPLRAAYAYDPQSGEWSPVADLPEGRQKPAGAFIDGTFVVAGGWGEDDFAPVATTVLYDPERDAWSTGAPNPAPHAASGTAVLDNQLYVVGGCDAECGSTDVLRYDLESDRWIRLADYPQHTAWTSCAGLRGHVYCAGGIGPGADLLSTYEYDPGTDRWRQVADMPVDLWASAVAVSDGRLIVAGGSAERSSVITNQTISYDPVTDHWSRLPNSTFALYRSAGACGLTKIGGSEGYFYGNPAVEQLPGMYDCAPSADQEWLRLTPDRRVLPAGHHGTVRVRLDTRTLDEPGRYVANVRIGEGTPWETSTFEVVVHVTPRRH